MKLILDRLFRFSVSAEAIAINPVTNKIYVTNSNKHILYEIEA